LGYCRPSVSSQTNTRHDGGSCPTSLPRVSGPSVSRQISTLGLFRRRSWLHPFPVASLKRGGGDRGFSNFVVAFERQQAVETQVVSKPLVDRFAAVPGRPMLTPLQAKVLGVLSHENEEAIPPREIFQRLGLERPTPSHRASLSRSLAQLSAKGLVVGPRGNIEFRNHNWSPSAPSGKWLASSEGGSSQRRPAAP
jgi:DNA-binding MarR family transcriptional regulator